MKNTVELTLKGDAYFADFISCEETYELFGTTRLLTAYRLPMTFAQAKAFLQAINPECKIVVIK